VLADGDELKIICLSLQSGALNYEPIPMQNSAIDQTYGSTMPGSELDVKSQIDQQFVEISNQFNELSTQYDSYTGQDQAAVAPVPIYGQNYDQQNTYAEQLQQQPPPSLGQASYYGQPVVESEPAPQQQQYGTDYGQSDYNNYAGDGSHSQTDGFGQHSYDAWSNQQNSEVSKSKNL
jgi:hypothetical protein